MVPKHNKQTMRLCTSAVFICFVIIIFQHVANQQILFPSAYSSIKIIPDDDGVPIVDYGCRGETYIGQQRNPITISQAALEHYETYNRNHDRVYLQKFLNDSNWLVENAVSYGNFSILEYHFFWPTYNMEPPWRSGMAQGQALEVLIKAHDITNDKKYLETAKSLLNAFFVEVKDGGVTYKTPNEGWWYELYASPEGVESRVLNGQTFALLGIYKYFQYTNDPSAKYLFDQGIIALKETLPRYEYAGGGQYSTYDILNNTIPATPLYHFVQTTHLGELYNITGEAVFERYYENWTNFVLDENVAQGKRLYYDPNKINPNFVPADENFIPLDDGRISKIENSNTTKLPLKFRIEGVNGNETARFSSDWFYYVGKSINVTIGDKIRSHTNLNLSFIVLGKGLSDEKKITFLHGPAVEGWRDNINYFVAIDSNSSKSINVAQLFGRDSNYMLLKRMLIEIPENACVNSMEFAIDLK